MANQGHSNENCSAASGSDRLEHEKSSNVSHKNLESCTSLPPTSTSTEDNTEANYDGCEVESLPGLKNRSPQGILRNCATCPELSLRELKIEDIDENDVQNMHQESAQLSKTDEIKSVFEKLVDENGNLDMRNVTTLIWLNRNQPSMIQTITEQLMANSSDRVVFNGIEFYLPQLAHMIVHLNIPTSALEQFSLVICQQSLMVALQLQWVLLSALEDYQPERPDGTVNPHSQPKYFNRCVKFLQKVEVIVALGPPQTNFALSDSESMSTKEMEEVRLERKKVQAKMAIMQCSSLSTFLLKEGEGERTGADVVGFLLHKRWHKRSRPHSHSWIQRYFRIHGNVIFCYSMLQHGKIRLKRALVLAGAHLDAGPQLYKNGKYEHYFEIRSTLGCWRLRATNNKELELWINAIDSAMRFIPSIPTLSGSLQAPCDDSSHGLSISQQIRFEFFCQERNFIRDLTDICENLRFVENRSARSGLLEKQLQDIMIPEDVFVPLCKSVDPYQRILRIVPGEAKAFSTKERVPTLIMVESIMTWHAGEKDDTEPLDVANYMYWTYVHDKEASNSILYNLNHSTAALFNTAPDKSEDTTLMKAFHGGKQDKEEHVEHGSIFSRHLLNRGHDIGREKSCPAEFFEAADKTPTVQISAAELHTDHFDQTKHRKFKNVWRDTHWTQGSFFPFRTRTGSIDSKTKRKSSSFSKRMLHSILNRNDEEKTGEEHDGDVTEYKTVGSHASASTDGHTEGEAPIVDADQVMSYGESLEEKSKRLFLESPYVTKGWGLQGFIAKSNDDLRQEVFVMQLVSFYSEVFEKEGLDLWLQPYRILSTGKRTGLIQLLENSLSITSSKKKDGWPGSLNAHFERLYGKPGSKGLQKARRRFAQSLAGYSILCYLLSIKDRHNGNIMLTAEGRLIHIDFGFVFGQAPGNQFSFERSAFKITQEYIDTLGGEGSEEYTYFAKMVIPNATHTLEDGLLAARTYSSQASILVEIMMFNSEFPCFKSQGANPLHEFRSRFFLNLSEEQVRVEVRKMLKFATNHIGTRLYDQFQRLTNGILP
eukprot:101583_1